MTYKAYLDNVQAKTGKPAEDYRKMARDRGLKEYGELLKWLKNDCGLGHGHANAVILYIRDPALAKKKIAAETHAKKPSGKRKK